MTIYAITGDIGSGKSLRQLSEGLRLCQKYKKNLVTNFGVNRAAVKRYAASRKYWHVVQMIDNQQLTTFDLQDTEQLPEILSVPGSVVLLDEAGIFFNTREFSKTPKSLLMDLAQSRKTGCDLIYASQFDGQVDKQFRMLTQYFTHCGGVTAWSKKLGNQKLVWKYYSLFSATKYWEWITNMSRRNNPFRTWFAATSTEFGPLNKSDVMLFKCFESFARLDNQASNACAARSGYTGDESLVNALSHSTKAAAVCDRNRRIRAAIARNPACVLNYSPKVLSRAYGCPSAGLRSAR